MQDIKLDCNFENKIKVGLNVIKFNKEKKLITINNGNVAYVIYINDAKYLEKIYFGKSMADMEDFEQIRLGSQRASSYYDMINSEQKFYSDDLKIDNVMLELSPHGTWDKRYSPIILNREDGSYESNFKYVSHKIYNGLPAVDEPMPHAHGNNAQTIEILCKDVYADIFVTVIISIFADKNVILKNFKIENKTENTIRLARAMSMQMDLVHKNYDLVHFGGRWGKERDYMESPLHDGTQEISSNFGSTSHAQNTFLFLKEKGANFEKGEVIGFNLIYSGNFKFRVDMGKFHSTQITYGINDEDFLWNIKADDDFITPQAVIAYSTDGIDGMSQAMHSFVKENIITYRDELKYKPVLFNSWEGCYFTFTTQSILEYIDSAVKIGTEIFVLDDGWFGKRSNDFSGLGDWFVNNQKVDLRKIIDRCKEKGIKFGIWFEPEMINPDSDLFRKHPEYVLGYKEGIKDLSLGRNQFHLDFANPAVVDEIYRQMKAFLDEYHVDYIKWDYNRTVAEHFSASCKKSQGEVYHRLVLGYYDLLNRLTKEYPRIMFEGCASGGGRYDLGTLYYAPQIWCSDQSNPAERMFINFNTSLGYPLSTIGAHVNDSKVASYTTKARLALFGTYGYEMNCTLLTESEIKELSAVAEIYKKYHSDVIQNGTLYHLVNPTECNFMGMQCVNKEKSTSLVLYMSKLMQPDVYNFLKLKGLVPNKLYRNDFDNCVHSGEYYMQVGLNFTLHYFNEFTAYLITLTEVK